MLLLVGGGAAYWLFAGETKPTELAAGAPEPLPATPPNITYFDVPDIIVNIQGADSAPAYLKLSVSLELDNIEEKGGHPGADAARRRPVPGLSARAAHGRPQRLGRHRAAEGRAPAPHQHLRRALSGARRSAQANDRSVRQAHMADETSDKTDGPEPAETIAASATAQTGAAERILNQEEIDSLLGFDVNSTSSRTSPASRAIINSALVSYERLPMLEIVFDRLVRLMTTSLRNFTSDNVEVSLDSITSIRFGDYLNSIPLPAILAVFRAEQLDNYGLSHRRFQSHLFHRRRAARRPPRIVGDAHRGAALHHHRTHPGAAHDRGHPGRHVRRLRAPGAGELHARPPRDQPALRRHRAPRQRRLSWSSCASTWKTAAGAPNSCCLTRRWSRSASCCCSSSWAKNSAAIRSGRAISPPNCGPPMSRSPRSSTSRPCRSTA
ncbi:MAG: hypothetical protein WDM81_19340 [Rhizomicrobium sp.]